LIFDKFLHDLPSLNITRLQPDLISGLDGRYLEFSI
jgi:hypothetical protein